MSKSLEKVVSSLKERPEESTVVYCATTSEVEEVADTLRRHLADTKVVVRHYHGKLGIPLSFLPFCTYVHVAKKCPVQGTMTGKVPTWHS